MPRMPAGRSAAAVGYGGFWIRVVAAIIDMLIVYLALMPVRFALHLPIGFMGARHSSGSNPLLLVPMIGVSFLISTAAHWIYEAYFVSSESQATPGKMALGLRVTDTHFQPLSFGAATLRHFCKYLSSLTLGVGYALAGFSERKQALHDMIAGTLVVRR